MSLRRSLCLLALLTGFLLSNQKSHAAVCSTLASSPSQGTVLSALNSCGAGNSVQLVAGTTTVTSTINIPCGVTLVGPTATPATAEFTTSSGIYMFNTTGNCSSSGSTGLSYLHLNGGDVLEVDASNHSNIVLTHNQFTAIPQNAAVEFDQGNGNTINGVTIEYNTIGDANSCTAVETQDTGGCGIEFFGESSTGSHMVNMVMKYNTFNHVNEASHFYGSCYYANCGSGPTVNSNPVNTCDNCDIEYNYFTLNHRITLEYQMQTINHPLIIANNVFFDTLNGYYGTYFISTPCCQYGSTINSSTISPSSIGENNVMITGTSGQTGGCSSGGSPCDEAEWGWEYWGNGSVNSNNLVQGLFCAGYVVGYQGNTPSSLQYNTIQGPLMNGGTCVTYPGSGAYITPEYSNYMGVTVTPNTTGATPSSVTSIAPTISPASGSATFPLAVTLTDNGYTSSTTPYPLGNTGIWYTTDGSTPVPGSGTAKYAASGSTITLAAAGTVKAVGMWGTPPQPASYPSGYGFIPSAVVTATYTAGGGGGGSTSLGTTTDNYAGGTYPNYFNSLYAITAINPAGFTVNSGTVCIAPGTVTNGAKTDIGLSSAPTSTTEGTTAICHGTYTNTSNTSPGCVTVPISGCGLLASDKPYWIWTITNDPLGPSPLYFSNCGGACNGGAPTSPGVGTYAGYYVGGTYGSYASMPASFQGQNSDQPSVSLGVTPAVQYGVTATSVNDATSANYFNDVYAITGPSSGGYTVNAGTVCIAPGTVTNGAKTDIGINTAPTSTTEGATAICHGTYTNTSTTSPGCVTIPLNGCGTLAPNTPYWLWTITNDPIQGSPLYFSNCGGTCNGSAPTSAGVGTYGGYYLHGTYGTYTGMSSAFTGGPSPAQPSVSLSVTPH